MLAAVASTAVRTITKYWPPHERYGEMDHPAKTISLGSIALRYADERRVGSFGLQHISLKHRTLEETVWRFAKTDLMVLPAVRQERLFHTSEILAAEVTRNLFDRLRATYD
jgi:hypothetical protein